MVEPAERTELGIDVVVQVMRRAMIKAAKEISDEGVEDSKQSGKMRSEGAWCSPRR